MNVLVVAAHPDDEVLGCGATIYKHVSNGDSVSVCVLADGEGSRGVPPSENKRLAQFAKAMLLLGVKHFETCALEDQRLETYGMPLLSQRVSAFVNHMPADPEVVYTHWRGDLNWDHRLTAEAVLLATRFEKLPSVRSVFGFEVPESTSLGDPAFRPSAYVSLTEMHLLKKKASLSCYEGERRNPPHARSEPNILSQAVVRGAECGRHYAEAFHVYKDIR